MSHLLQSVTCLHCPMPEFRVLNFWTFFRLFPLQSSVMMHERPHRHRPIGWNDIEYSRKYTINMRTSHWIRTQLTNWPQTSSESSGSCNRGSSSNTSTVWHRDFIAPGLCVNRVEYMTDEGIVTFELVGNVYDVSLTTNLSFRPAWRRNGQVIRCGWRGIALRNVRRLLQSSGRSRRHNGYILHQDQWLCSRRPTIR